MSKDKKMNKEAILACDILANVGCPEVESLREDNQYMRSVIKQVLFGLPMSKDWLDPALEKQMKAIAEEKHDA